LDVLAVFIFPGFLVGIILRDDGLELMMGLSIADLLAAFLMVSTPDVAPAIPG